MQPPLRPMNVDVHKFVMQYMLRMLYQMHKITTQVLFLMHWVPKI